MLPIAHGLGSTSFGPCSPGRDHAGAVAHLTVGQGGPVLDDEDSLPFKYDAVFDSDRRIGLDDVGVGVQRVNGPLQLLDRAEAPPSRSC